MRLLVADKLDCGPLAELEMLGVELVIQPDLTTEQLPAALEGVNVLVVRSTKVTADAIHAARQLNLIVRAGAGVNTIDVPAASQRGIFVANCPGRNAVAVAELAMAHILALDRRLVDATASLRAGRWEKAAFQRATGISGRRLGVAGLGQIGCHVVKRAQAFGMAVGAWSRSLSTAHADELGVQRCQSLEALAARSDVLSLHLPLTEHTRGIVGRSVLEALPDGAILVNTARAEILDYAALSEVASTKGLKLGLDVFPDEPKSGSAEFHASILSEGVVCGTPHIGASTQQAQLAVAGEVTRIVRCFLTEEDVPNVVNVCRNTPARYALVLRGLDEVGVLANVFGVLKRHGLNIEECNNTVFTGAAATCTKLRLSGRPNEACLNEIRSFDEVLHVHVLALPNLA